MSRLSGWIDPETRCYVEAVTAAVRPGRHLPDGTFAEVRDERSPDQRCHDGIKLGLSGIASGEMGQHRGHPITVIVRTTLAELNQAAHAVTNPDIPMPPPARTGGDTALPMRDLIRMGDGRYPLSGGIRQPHRTTLYLGRQARIATADQRIICYARDGGCTHPNCLEPGITAKCTTAPTGWLTAPPTPTSCSSPADATTVSLPRATAKPSSPTPGDWRGPTASNHPKSTTRITPTNYCAATPTHQTTSRSETGDEAQAHAGSLGAQRF